MTIQLVSKPVGFVLEMSYRFMRILVFFDLPVTTRENRREYVSFRKYLIKSGFMMVQESVYAKLVLNAVVGNAVVLNVKNNAPSSGLVQLLTITEKQYAKMLLIIGKEHSEVVDNDDRLVIL